NGEATGALQRTRKAVEVADGEGIEVDEFRTAVAQAETDLKAGRPGAVLQAIGQIDRLVSERRRTRQQEEQRRALEMARTAATKVISVKKLIEDLRKADIDITGAEERLRAGARALEKRKCDDGEAVPPAEGTGRRPRADRRDSEDDRGPVPGRHLDPRRGGGPRAGRCRLRFGPFRRARGGAPGDRGDGRGTLDGTRVRRERSGHVRRAGHGEESVLGDGPRPSRFGPPKRAR